DRVALAMGEAFRGRPGEAVFGRILVRLPRGDVMAERRENSVLFSLKELRQIEDDRVKQEEDAVRAQVEAERAAKEAAERAAAAEIERQRREEQDRILAAQQAREHQERQHQLQLEAAKHKAALDAQASVEAARVQAEIAAREAAVKRAPIGVVLG